MGESSDTMNCTQRETLQALQASGLTLNQRLTAAQLAWLAEVERTTLERARQTSPLDTLAQSDCT